MRGWRGSDICDLGIPAGLYARGVRAVGTEWICLWASNAALWRLVHWNRRVKPQ